MMAAVMPSGVQRMYLWAGAPPLAKHQQLVTVPPREPCWLCGGMAATVGTLPLRKGVNFSTFSDTNAARCEPSGSVCAACAWSLEGRPPDCLRANSLYVDSAGLFIRCNRKTLAATFRAIPQQAAKAFVFVVAVSGKKHLVFRARAAYSKKEYPILFETEIVWVNHAMAIDILDRVELLMAAGVSRTSIETGRYKYQDWKKHRTLIEEQEAYLKMVRTDPVFKVMVYIAKKEK